MAPRIKHAAGSKEFESITFYKVNAEESEVLFFALVSHSSIPTT